MSAEKYHEKDYPYQELTQEVIGLVFSSFKKLGYGYQEKYYQRGTAEELKNNKIEFKREKVLPIKYDGKIIGRYFVDFIVKKALVVELKVAADFYEAHVNQVLAYMKHGGYKVGLLFVITKNGVRVKRFVNSR